MVTFYMDIPKNDYLRDDKNININGFVHKQTLNFKGFIPFVSKV